MRDTGQQVVLVFVQLLQLLDLDVPRDILEYDQHRGAFVPFSLEHADIKVDDVELQVIRISLGRVGGSNALLAVALHLAVVHGLIRIELIVLHVQDLALVADFLLYDVLQRCVLDDVPLRVEQGQLPLDDIDLVEVVEQEERIDALVGVRHLLLQQKGPEVSVDKGHAQLLVLIALVLLQHQEVDGNVLVHQGLQLDEVVVLFVHLVEDELLLHEDLVEIRHEQQQRDDQNNEEIPDLVEVARKQGQVNQLNDQLEPPLDLAHRRHVVV